MLPVGLYMHLLFCNHIAMHHWIETMDPRRMHDFNNRPMLERILTASVPSTSQ